MGAFARLLAILISAVLKRCPKPPPTQTHSETQGIPKAKAVVNR